MDIRNRLQIIKHWSVVEQAGYWLVWMLLLALPLIFWDFNDPFQHRRIIGGWIRILPYLIIFLIHNLYLLPRVLLQKKYWLYLTATLAVILLVNYWFVLDDQVHFMIRQFLERNNLSAEDAVALHSHGQLFRPGSGPSGHPGEGMGFYGGSRRGLSDAMVYVYSVLVSFLLVGFNITLKLASRWLQQEQWQKENEKETLKAKLAALQNQVSPHFFMNTLNNIHALIDYSREDAKDAVVQLSKLMRFMLYNTSGGVTTLEDEMQFYKNYIHLMHLRLQPEVDLRVVFPDPVPHFRVYSLLGIALIENAFKYGVRAQGASFIYIEFETRGTWLYMNCRNSKATPSKMGSTDGGIGIANTRRRLDLLFPEAYSLTIYDREQEFEVNLNYPMQ